MSNIVNDSMSLSHSMREVEESGENKDRELFDFIRRETSQFVAKELSRWTAAEIEKYRNSEDMVRMVDTMKRRERERVLAEIRLQIESDRKLIHEQLLESLKLEELSKIQSAEKILIENKLKMEEQQRKVFEEKMKADAERLRQIQLKHELEEVIIHQYMILCYWFDYFLW